MPQLRQAITVGFPGINFVCETGSQDGILPGTYVCETISASGPQPVPPGQAKKHHVLAEMERVSFNEDEFFPGFNKRLFTIAPLPVQVIKPAHHIARYEEPEPDWAPLIRTFAVRPLPVLHIKPAHHIARYEEPEPDWAPLIRGAAQGPLPAPPQVRPWRHSTLFEELDAEWSSLRPPAAIAPLPLPPRYRPWWHGILHEEGLETDPVPSRPGTPPPPAPPPIVVLPWHPPIFERPEDDELLVAIRRFAVLPSTGPPGVWFPWRSRVFFERPEDDELVRVRQSAPPSSAIVVVPWHPPIFERPEDDELLVAIRRALTTLAPLPPLGSRPWWHDILHEELPEADPIPPRRGTPPPPPPPPIVALPWRQPIFFERSEDGELPGFVPLRFALVRAPTPSPAGVHETLFIANLGRLMNRR